MNYNFIFIIVALTNSFILMFAMTNLLLYPIRYYHKLFVYIYLLICQICLGSIFGQSITLLLIGGPILIIAASNKHFIANSLFALIGYIIAVLINYLITLSLSIFDISIASVVNYNYSTVLFVIIYGILTYIITYCLGTLFRKKFLKINFPHMIQVLLLLQVLSFTLIFIYNIVQEGKSGYPVSIIYFNAFLFIAFFAITFIIFFFSVRTMQKNHELLSEQKEKQSLEEYMKKVEDLYQDSRNFRHDYINILSTMKYYINSNDNADLKNYFDSTIIPTSEKLRMNEAILGKLGNIKILELKGILYAKLVSAINQKLKITLEIENEIQNISMEKLDLSTVVGIFLDNAIEASQESVPKELIVLIIRDSESIIINISNSTANTDIHLDHIYKKDFSSKKEHSGIGLYNASQILAKYDNIIHTTNYENNYFSQTLEICTTS